MANTSALYWAKSSTPAGRTTPCSVAIAGTAVTQPDHGHAVPGGALDPLLHGLVGHDLAEAGLAVQGQQRAGVGDIAPHRRVGPLPAAVAVEAAGQQGQYEAMYQQMFDTQEQWSHTTEDRSPVFRGYAEDLGLDMAAYDAAVADPATRDRVELDVADGTALGVAGTPTFYLDGEPLTVNSLEEFTAAVEAATQD